MRNLKLKGLVAITLSAVLLTGCTAHEDLIINDPRPSVNQEQTFEPVIPNNQNQSEETISNEQTPSTEEFTFFSDAKKE